MPRITVSRLVTEDLGYCCLWFFFLRYRQTSVIADRLGVSPSTIKAHRARLHAGLYSCANRPGCMKRLGR